MTTASAGPDGRVVPGHVGELVHHRERHDPAQPGDQAVHGTGRVEPGRALLAAQDRDVAVGDAGRLQLGGDLGRLLAASGKAASSESIG